MAAHGYREDPFKGVSSHRYHYRFLKPDGFPVEVHDKLGTAFAEPFPSGPFLDRATLYRTAHGRTAWTLSPEDEGVFLVAHAAKHMFSQLVLLYDLRLFLAGPIEIDWELLARRAAHLRLSNTLAFGGSILERRLKVSLPLPPYRGRPGVDRLYALEVSPSIPDGMRSLATMLIWILLSEDAGWAAGNLKLLVSRNVRSGP
jgi:hypothetical protein